MKKTILLGLLFTLPTTLDFIHAHTPETIRLEWIKSPEGALKPEFLHALKRWFTRDTFIETGTYAGETTERAALVFNKIYSVELGEKMYQEACKRFKNNAQVRMYHGDSGTALTKILPHTSGKIIFWLDAHYCGTGTGRGNCDSPAIQELQAIQASTITDGVVLVDDLRCFYSENWPQISEIINALQIINPQYKIVAFGDTIMAYPQSTKIVTSLCVEACTISRFFDAGCTNYTIEELFKAEETIACTNGTELTALQRYFLFFKESDDHHGLLWKGLIAEQSGQYIQACALYKEILNSSKPRKINHWRIQWYYARAAFKAGNKNVAQRALLILLQNQPHFKPAQDLLYTLSN